MQSVRSSMSDARRSRMPRASVVALIAAVILIVAAVALYQAGGGPVASALPSTAALASKAPATIARDSPAASEPPGPTVDPGSVDRCSIRQLALTAGGWGGATGSLGGGASVINVSSKPCRIAGRPALQLRDATGKPIAGGPPASPGAAVALVPGDVGGLIIVWSNWCHDPPERPLSIRMTIAGISGTLDTPVVDWNSSSGVGGSELSSLPRCDVEGDGSSIGAPEPFRHAERPEPGVDDAACVAEDLVGFLGGWGGAAGTSAAPAVLFNQGGGGCLLDGSPALELRDADGKLLVRGQPWPGAASIDLPAGLGALTFVGFADWCLPRPQLPFDLDVRIAGEPVRLAPVSELSRIGVPTCQSEPPAAEPDLLYTGPFAVPDS